MGLQKSALIGAISVLSALALSACHGGYHNRTTYVAPHHRTTVVHPPARHRTVIVNPPSRQRTVIVNPPSRHRTVIVNPPPRHRTVIVNPPAHGREWRRGRRPHPRYNAAEVKRPRHGTVVRDRHRPKYRAQSRPARPAVPYRTGKTASGRDPRQMLNSQRPRGHISGGRPGRPDVVMPTRRHSKPYTKPTAQPRKPAVMQTRRPSRNSAATKPKKSNKAAKRAAKDVKDEASKGFNRRQYLINGSRIAADPFTRIRRLHL